MVLNTKRSALNQTLPMLVGGVLGLVCLYYFSLGNDSNNKFEELALGSETSSYFAEIAGFPIHCSSLVDAPKCIQGYNNNGKSQTTVLWLGNSQLHAVNHMIQGDITSTEVLHNIVALNSRYLITFSLPNASLQEHYLSFEYLSQQLPITTLILAVVFDDLRETGIRHSLIDAFKNLTVTTALNETEIGRRMIANQGDQDSAGNYMTALEDTIQEKSEKYLNNKLGNVWSVWEQRPKLRGDLLSALYLFRNWLFGINPSSTRRMIKGRYIMNIMALTAILESANEKEIDVLLYNVPLRNDVQTPYDLTEYSDFKLEIKTIAIKYKTIFVNLESLVPANFWGTKASTNLDGKREMDFMHFKAEGHRILATTLEAVLKTIWGNNN
jgi:hypothetical protein